MADEVTSVGEADEPPRAGLRENVESLLVAVLFALFVRGFIAQPYKIPSGSMEDNLLVGDHVVVNKVAYGDGADRDGPALLPTRPIRRGDVVIFRPPHDDDTDYIKRVIGLPGEEVSVVLDPARTGARVFIDGRPLPESFRIADEGETHEEDGASWVVKYAGRPPEAASGRVSRRFQVGPSQYFVMGDNRNDSRDSRAWGPPHAVDAERIRGHAWLIYWSYDGKRAEPGPGLGERLRFYGEVAAGFVTRTRWSRTLMRIPQ